MNLLRIYHISLIASCVLYLAYWFAPWLYGYLDTESQQILALEGSKATLTLPVVFWDFYLFFTLVSYVGMFLLRKAFRTLFIVLLVGIFPVQSLMGIGVTTGIESVIVEISTLLTGVVIALAYFTELKDKFY